MLFFWPRGNVELGGGGEGVVSLKQNDSTHMYQRCANPVPPTIETFPRQISFLTRRARTNFRDTNSANGEKSSATSSQWSLLRLAWWLHDATSPEEVCQHTDFAIFDWEGYLQYKKEKREQTLSGGGSKTFKITKAYSIFEALAFTHCQEPITI